MTSFPDIPSATYRFQFHKEFTFEKARALVPYLAQLGVTHVYASPFFRAAPGSQHGYDICDHNELNPEVGTRAELEALSADLQADQMGLIVDFVPNHMGIAEPQNRWWMDVLENGPSSPYARFFDIDWQPLKRELENRVLLPTLGDQYGRVLERGELQISFVEGAFTLNYYALSLPIAPRTTRLPLERAAELLGESAPAEFASIITALEHLPPRTETAKKKIEERARDAQIIRERLARLCRETPEVESAVQAAVAEFNNVSIPANVDRLDELIDAQPYRLSYWKVASEEINYRRFFDVNTLAAIRMELPEVFEATHRLLLDLIRSRIVTGVRIDHIDGLANPGEYLEVLQAKAAEAFGTAPGEASLYLLVEKILGPNERLRSDWPIHGTTGYEFVNQVNAVLIDPAARDTFTEIYRKFLGFSLDYREVTYRSKRLVMQVSLASEVNVLGQLLNRLSETNRWYRDFTINALTTAVREVIACFPVYRSYLVPGRPPEESDRKVILRALAQARRRNRALERSVFEFLRDVLLPSEVNPHPLDEELRRTFVLKFQQCTGPITAKGVEDTAFYVYNRLIALNEVGGEPSEFGAPVATFHTLNAARGIDFPHSMLTTSTHDTKRSEDVRARLAALSEIPQEWARAVRRWQTANARHKQQIDSEPVPDANEEYLLYQTLVGSWPLDFTSANALPDYLARVQAYMVKALHEAKVNSSWIEPNETWDTSVQQFVERILAPGRGNAFRAAFEPFAERVAQLGAINSLAQTVLKLTVPGVPDLYQGSDLWDFSLVDPDNRRPVDYAVRERVIASLADVPPADLLASWRDGRIKLFAIQTLLRLRLAHRDIFASGSYEALELAGDFAECAVAFARSSASTEIIILVPRLSSRVGFPPVGAAWKETLLLSDTRTGSYRELFTGRVHPATPSGWALSELLAELPFAVLVSES